MFTYFVLTQIFLVLFKNVFLLCFTPYIMTYCYHTGLSILMVSEIQDSSLFKGLHIVFQIHHKTQQKVMGYLDYTKAQHVQCCLSCVLKITFFDIENAANYKQKN